MLGHQVTNMMLQIQRCPISDFRRGYCHFRITIGSLHVAYQNLLKPHLKSSGACTCPICTLFNSCERSAAAASGNPSVHGTWQWWQGGQLYLSVRCGWV